jgi:hypothetical protein
MNKRIKEALMKGSEEGGIPPENWVSTGLTPLNLGCSGHIDRGLAVGLCYNYVGDSSAGKTWLAMTNAAEISINPRFDDYQIVYEPAENGAKMNIRKHFGRKLAKRIRPLKGTWLNPDPSHILEDFYKRLEDLHAKGKPYWCCLDSMDVLIPKAYLTYKKKIRAAEAKGQEGPGNYGLDKAKINSAELRPATARLRDNRSMLTIISQTRHNIGWGSQFNPKTMAGGDAIKFYSQGVQLWLSRVKTEYKKIGKEKVKVGQYVQAKITKNHLSGWEGTITFPLFKGVGIDDLGACVDYLVDYGHWTEKKGVIQATEFEVTKRREDLIKYVEVTDQQRLLKRLVAYVWKQVERKTTVERKSRYD